MVEVFEALPAGTPISLEIRSRALRERYADPVERAGKVLTAARRLLD